MEFYPKCFPLFGGQKIEISFKNEMTEELDGDSEYSDIYLHFHGRNTCHLCSVVRQNEKIYSLIPENERVENKTISLFYAFFNDVTKNNIHQIKKLDFDQNEISYCDDELDSYSNEISVKLLKNISIAENIEKLYNLFLTHFSTDEALENFDEKLSVLVKKSIECLKKRDFSSITSHINLDPAILKLLDLKCFTNTKEFIEKLIKSEEILDDIENFIYDVNDENVKTKYPHAVFIKEFTNYGISYLTYTTPNTEFHIEDQILTLSSFIRETHNMKVDIPSENTRLKSRTKTFNMINKDGDYPFKISVVDESSYENQNIDLNSSLGPPPEESLRNEYFPTLKKSSTFKEIEKSATNLIHLNLPNRSSSDATKEKKNISKEKKSSYKFSEESGIASRTSSCLNNMSHISPILSPSKNKPSLNIKSNDGSFKSQGNESEIFDVKEFLEKEVENLKDHPLKKTPIAANLKQNEKKNYVTKFFTRIFSKENVLGKSIKKQKKSKIMMNVNKGAFSSYSFINKSSENDIKLANIQEGLSNSENCIPNRPKLEDIEEEQNATTNENWNESVDEKIMKKMTVKEIRKQNIIFEIIKTEDEFVKTLKMLYRVYYRGLIDKLHFSKEVADRLIPRIIDLLSIHGTFLAGLMQIKNVSENNIINNIGDILLVQFTGPMLMQIEDTYGYICSNQQESKIYCNELLNERKFSSYVSECRNFKQLKRLDIKDAQNYITQRLFQYSLLIESILKYSKEGEKDYEKISKALEGCKQVTKNVNKAVEISENKKILKQIISKVDQKSEFLHEKEGILKLIDLLNNNQFIRKTFAHIQLKLKIYDVILVALENCLLLLCENNQKYYFIIHENRSPILYYCDLIVKIDAGNPKSFFIMDSNTNAFWKLLFAQEFECHSWFKFLQEKQKTAKKSESITSIDTKEKFENKKLISDLSEYGKKIMDSHNLIFSNVALAVEELDKINKNRIPAKSGLEKTISILKEILSNKVISTDQVLRFDDDIKKICVCIRTNTFSISKNTSAPLKGMNRKTTITTIKSNQDSPFSTINPLKRQLSELIPFLDNKKIFCITHQNKLKTIKGGSSYSLTIITNITYFQHLLNEFLHFLDNVNIEPKSIKDDNRNFNLSPKLSISKSFRNTKH